MRRWIITSAAAVAMAFLPGSRAAACTGITLRTQGGDVVVARTMEWGGSDLRSHSTRCRSSRQYRSGEPKGEVWRGFGLVKIHDS